MPNIENKKTRYLQFDTFTGELLSCVANRVGCCYEIDEDMGLQFGTGEKLLSRYKIIWKEGSPMLICKDFVTVEQYNNISHQQIENKNVYKIPSNLQIANYVCIKFYKKQKKLVFMITDGLKNNLQIFLKDKSDKIHRFFSTRRDDGTILDKIFFINLHDLVVKNQITYEYDPAFDIDLYCKKIFDYQFQTIYE